MHSYTLGVETFAWRNFRGKRNVRKFVHFAWINFRAWKNFSIKYRGRYFFLQECSTRIVASRSGDRTAKIIHQQQQRHLQMRLSVFSLVSVSCVLFLIENTKNKSRRHYLPWQYRYHCSQTDR